MNIQFEEYMGMYLNLNCDGNLINFNLIILGILFQVYINYICVENYDTISHKKKKLYIFLIWHLLIFFIKLFIELYI